MSTTTIDQSTIHEWLHPVGRTTLATWRQGFAAGQFESLLQSGQPFEFDLHGLPHHVFVARAEAMSRTVAFLPLQSELQSELERVVMVSGA